MKQLYICLLLLLLVSTSALAQKDFRKGYIVQNSDTLRGYVDYRGGVRNAQIAAFKSTLDGEEQTFSPDAIAGYGFENEAKFYESKLVTVGDTVSAEKRLVFLNALVKGKASIYYYLDTSHREHFYLAKDNGPLVALQEQEYLQKDAATGKTYKVTNKVFAGTLATALADCRNLTAAQFEKLNLTEKSLKGIAQKYNACVAPGSITHEQQSRKVKIAIGPVVTFFSSDLEFTGGTYLNRASFADESLRVGGGITLNASLPRLNEKLSVQIDLLYIASTYTSFLEEDESYRGKYTYDATLDLAYLKLPVQLRYTYPRGKLRPYGNAGLLIGYAIKDDNHVTKTHTLGSTSTYTDVFPAIPGNDYMNGFRNFMEGITAGAGLTYPLDSGNLSLEARYEVNNGMSGIQGIKSTVSTFYIMLGYSF